jgi:hypothetical protein
MPQAGIAVTVARLIARASAHAVPQIKSERVKAPLYLHPSSDNPFSSVTARIEAEFVAWSIPAASSLFCRDFSAPTAVNSAAR